MKESILLFNLKILAFLMRLLPFQVALFVGRCFGHLGYFFSGRYRRLVYSNLKQAFAQTKTPKELRRITKRFFCHMGENIIDFMRLPLSTKENFKDLVEIDGMHNAWEAGKKGKGVIFLTMHFGNWEMGSFACSVLGLPYHIFVRPQGRSVIEDWLNKYRACYGATVITRGVGMRDFIKCLRDNKSVGMVFDQGDRDGVMVSFLGRNARMSPGAIRMAVKSGVQVCVSVIYRQKNGKHKMRVYEPINVDSTQNANDSISQSVASITKTLETYIHDHPEQYLWTYKIWKYSDQAKIIILSDGKMGHENQSKASANILTKVLADRGIRATTEMVQVRFKSASAFVCFSLLNRFIPFLLRQGAIERLKMFLTQDSYKKIVSLNGDYFISAGSKTAAMSDVLKRETQGKNVHILNTGSMPVRRFNRVLKLSHDVASVKEQQSNVVVTKAALNLIDSAYLNEKKNALLNRFTHLQNKHTAFIGVFIGGESKSVRITEAQVKILVHQLEDVCRDSKATLLITTSRRTSNAVEKFLFKHLKKNPLCSLLVLAAQDDIPEAMGGILGLCDVAVVSGDSISMVSEAVSSGKPTIALYPQGEKGKHHRFINSLAEGGYALSSDAKGVAHAVYEVFKNKQTTKFLKDEDQVLNSFRTLI